MAAPAYVNHARSLHQRKHRADLRRFLVQGRKGVEELLRSGFTVEALYATAEAAALPPFQHATVVPAHHLERMGTLESGNEVLAIVHMPDPAALAVPAGHGFVLALDGVADPGNLGTLLRIADWFGATQVWCSEDCVDVWNPKCVQATMGSCLRVPVWYGDLATALMSANAAGVQVLKADAGGTDVFATALRRPLVLVLGSESHGLRPGVRQAPGITVAIPRSGGAESLNVSAAAAALCMEIARQGSTR